ncbi:MAG TPA: hypothetical protein VH139_10700 [Acidobacteriaceae bacterium]|jgi:hypothetical protein|nr:hypothetical protein [Acidobacteriaceae bacterium]
MRTSVKSESRDPWPMLVESRGIAIFLILSACWTLYLSVRHLSARFLLPHYFAIKCNLFGSSGWAFGSIGWAVDIFVYMTIAYLFFSLLQSLRDKVLRGLIIGLIGPVLINPVKMLVPKYASVIWWIELCLTMMFFVTSLILLFRTVRRNSVPGVSPDTDEVL